MTEINEVPKRCNFRGCINELSSDAAFTLCETCRTLYVSERVTLLSDPFSSRATNVKDAITSQLITAMSGSEVLALQTNLQYLYLEVCKIVKLHGLEQATPRSRAKLTEGEEIEKARRTNSNVEPARRIAGRIAAEKLSKLQKQMKTLGCKDPTGKKGLCPSCQHSNEAKRIFSDIAPSEDLGF